MEAGTGFPGKATEPENRYSPDEQNRHADDPAVEYSPGRQLTHSVALSPSVYFPLLHEAQTPVADEAPGVHVLQLVDEMVPVVSVVYHAGHWVHAEAVALA